MHLCCMLNAACAAEAAEADCEVSCHDATTGELVDI